MLLRLSAAYTLACDLYNNSLIIFVLDGCKQDMSLTQQASKIPISNR